MVETDASCDTAQAFGCQLSVLLLHGVPASMPWEELHCTARRMDHSPETGVDCTDNSQVRKKSRSSRSKAEQR